MNVNMWVEVFEAAGIDEAARHRWHVAFEQREPEEHRAFLAWLGLGDADIARIRADSRNG